MSEQVYKQLPFRSIITNQILKSVLFAFVISLPLIILPAYFVIQNKITSDIQKIETISYQAIGEHLSNGWSRHNLNKVYQELQKAVPNSTFFLNKELSLNPQVPLSVAKPKKHFKPLIEHVRKHEQLIIKTNLGQGIIRAAFPIQFQKSCLSCHIQQLKTGKIYAGGLAATMVLEIPISINHIPTDSILTFFIIYALIFVLLTSLFSLLLIEKRLLLPIIELDNRVKKLKISAHIRDIDWQRTPQSVLEFDEIDASLTEHMDSIHHLYKKLDKFIINEPHTGILNEALYHDTIKKELKRSLRYRHPFSVLVIKLLTVKVLNPTAKNLELEDPETKYLIFGEILQRDSRETDSIFRLEETIFALIAPETGIEGAKVLKKDIYRRLISSELSNEIYDTVAIPEYQFTIQVGVATSDEDQVSEKNLTKSAMLSLRNSAKVTGRYPSQKK